MSFDVPPVSHAELRITIFGLCPIAVRKSPPTNNVNGPEADSANSLEFTCFKNSVSNSLRLSGSAVSVHEFIIPEGVEISKKNDLSDFWETTYMCRWEGAKFGILQAGGSGACKAGTVRRFGRRI